MARVAWRGWLNTRGHGQCRLDRRANVCRLAVVEGTGWVFGPWLDSRPCLGRLGHEGLVMGVGPTQDLCPVGLDLQTEKIKKKVQD